MAIIKAVSSKSSIGRAIKYVTKDEKTERKLISGKDVSTHCPTEDMQITKQLYRKKGGREYEHLIQSFPGDEKVNAEEVHEIGKEFVEKNEKFNDFQVLIVTHKDKEHLHNHFIINSVNFKDGKKYQRSKFDLEKYKKLNNEICKARGLSIPVKGKSKTISTYSQGEYRAYQRAIDPKENYKFWKLQTALDVEKSLDKASNRKDFIKEMGNKGYKVKWTDSRKYVTFENADGKKVRNSNLKKTFNNKLFEKEKMYERLEKNKREIESKQKDREVGKTKAISKTNSPNLTRPNENSRATDNNIERSSRKDNERDKSNNNRELRKTRATRKNAHRNSEKDKRTELLKNSKDTRNDKNTEREVQSREYKSTRSTKRSNEKDKKFEQTEMERTSKTIFNKPNNNEYNNRSSIYINKSYNETFTDITSEIEKINNKERLDKERIKRAKEREKEKEIKKAIELETKVNNMSEEQLNDRYKELCKKLNNKNISKKEYKEYEKIDDKLVKKAVKERKKEQAKAKDRAKEIPREHDRSR